MLPFLIAALMLGGAHAQVVQEWRLPKAYANLGFATSDFTITDEWQSLLDADTDRERWQPTTVPMAHLDEGWMGIRGLSFQVNTDDMMPENVKFLAFHDTEAEYLGYLAWYGLGVRFEDRSGYLFCDQEMLIEGVYGVAGEWSILADGEETLYLYYIDEYGSILGVTSLNIPECAPWILRAKQVGFGGFSDWTQTAPDQVKYTYEYTPTPGPDTGDDNEAEDEAETADMCQRGQFYWMEKCQDCPPGHSTVRQGNTDFNDCIENRYISCQMHTENDDMEHEVMECDRVLCPCNEPYEECDWNTHSQEYGKCKQSSQYASSARGFAGVTTLVVMVTTFFSL